MSEQARALTVVVKLPTCEGLLGPEAYKFNGRTHCGNHAKFAIEGKNLCVRHAQQAALEILLRRPLTTKQHKQEAR